ncbi:unnamed protein product [Rhizophagus irregularis]|nr:unnamed protein product [Rhizophagus irregularis]
MKVALKKLNDSQNISVEDLNELQIHWDYFKKNNESFLKFYGMTKDPEDNKDCQDSQLLDLEVSSSFQSREIIDDENSS